MGLVQRNHWSPKNVDEKISSGDRLGCRPKDEADAGSGSPGQRDRHLLLLLLLCREAVRPYEPTQRREGDDEDSYCQVAFLEAKCAVLVINEEGLCDRFS